jgi:hypothetical protein
LYLGFGFGQILHSHKQFIAGSFYPQAKRPNLDLKAAIQIDLLRFPNIHYAVILAHQVLP